MGLQAMMDFFTIDGTPGAQLVNVRKSPPKPSGQKPPALIPASHHKREKEFIRF
jgi:hypothetical protein